MGAWGTALYSDDYAADVRADYRELLKNGKTDEEALQEVARKDAPPVGSEDEYVFWYALADTLWNYGRLTPEVKEKALYFLETVKEDDRWDNEKTWEKRKAVLQKLKEKLLSEQPPRKKVSIYVPYRCPWNVGDVFAYQFRKPISEEYGVKGKYIVFRKVAEVKAWPDNTIPVVAIYRWMGDEIPALEAIKEMPYVVMNSVSLMPEYKNMGYLTYSFAMSIGSKRELSMQHFQYIGNLQDDRFKEVPTQKANDTGKLEGRGINIFELCFLQWCTTIENGNCVFRDDV